MLLAIDVGNTDTVFGLWAEGEWRQSWRIASTHRNDPEYWYAAMRQRFAEHALGAGSITQVVLSSVVPQLSPIVAECAEKLSGRAPLIVGPALYGSLNVQVHNADEMGTDLVANAVAAYTRFGQACVVVDFGTALTFTALNNEGRVVGVAITPGLQTAMRALFQHAAQLPEVPLHVPDSVLGQNTTHALQAGILLGYVGLVDALLDRIEVELNQRCRVVATGGLSSVLTPLHHRFDLIDKMLTLEGLRLIAGQCT